jgi:hypothetical protein
VTKDGCYSRCKNNFKTNKRSFQMGRADVKKRTKPREEVKIDNAGMKGGN